MNDASSYKKITGRNKNKKVKILLALARGQAHKLEFGPINMSFREAPLTITTLAALVPEEINADITVIDESVSKIPFTKDFDLVGVSVMTGTSTRAYEIADHFRKKGSTVILGGVHVTLMPEEAKKHADTIVIGFAEKTWPQLLHDYAKNELKERYEDHAVSIENLPSPRRDLQKKFGYAIPNTVFATRGCRARCEFCSVVAANFGWHKRPIPDVIDELKKIKRKRFVFNDVNLTDDVEYAKELFKAMIPLKFSWGGLASTKVINDDELLDLLQKSGCDYLLLGFESFSQNSLRNINKGFNKFEEYKMVVDKLHDKNIIIQGCFIFGIDGEDKNIFQTTVDCINDLKIDIPRYAVFTPYPGTKAFKRLKREKRILHEKWEYYDTQHVVHLPDNMSPKELDEGFKWAYKETFKIKNSYKRTFVAGNSSHIAFIGNLVYKLYVKKLYREKYRFPKDLIL